MGVVDRLLPEGFRVGISVREQRLGFPAHALINVRIGKHRKNRERHSRTRIHGRHERDDRRKLDIGLRKVLGVAGVQAEQVVGQVAGLVFALSRRVRVPDHGIDMVYASCGGGHSRRSQEKLRQGLLHVGD